VSDAEQGKQAMYESTRGKAVPPLLQQPSQIHASSILAPLQTIQMRDGNSDGSHTEQLTSANHCEMNTRWREICQQIRIDTSLEEEKRKQLWRVLEQYQDIFAWNKGELGCCTIGEHFVDTQGFPPCKASPSRLSYWEEAEVKR
jgi:hypothetical protein